MSLLTPSMVDRLRPSPGVLDGCAIRAERGGMAYIFYDLILRMPALKSEQASRALGRVIAHEVGHLLLPRGHTSNGLMRPIWDPRELKSDDDSSFVFTAQQAAMMRAVV